MVCVGALGLARSRNIVRCGWEEDTKETKKSPTTMCKKKTPAILKLPPSRYNGSMYRPANTKNWLRFFRLLYFVNNGKMCSRDRRHTKSYEE